MRILESRVIQEGPGHNDISYREYAGTHDETKPTTGIATGSSFLEVDTTDVYFFSEDDSTWYKAGGE